MRLTIVISGGVFAIIGVFASLTVVGVPLGAVLTVLEISYGLYAWMLDQVFSQRGYYTTEHGYVCRSFGRPDLRHGDGPDRDLDQSAPVRQVVKVEPRELWPLRTARSGWPPSRSA